MPPARLSTDRLLAFSAVFLSLAALVVSVLQTQILRDQQRSSVWPHLQVYAQVDEPELAYQLVNNGVGPAIVESFAIEWEGETYAGMEPVLRELMARAGGPDSLGDFGWYYTEVLPGEVIPAGGSVRLGQVLHSYRFLRDLQDAIADESFHVRIRYADVYGETWDFVDGAVVEQ